MLLPRMIRLASKFWKILTYHLNIEGLEIIAGIYGEEPSHIHVKRSKDNAQNS